MGNLSRTPNANPEPVLPWVCCEASGEDDLKVQVHLEHEGVAM